MEQNNIDKIKINDKEIIIIGTAHVSKKSSQQVKAVIEKEQPDTVCVELDEQRYKSIYDEEKWKEMDIFKVIKQKKALLLLVNLLLGSFQRRIAKQFGINPGQEMIQGIESAREMNAALVLADRNIQITFKRVWRGLGFWEKIKLVFQMLFMIFSDTDISEDELEKLKSNDLLTTMLTEMGEGFPKLKERLIDERDKYLSHKIKNAPGQKIVAVLGAGHVPGVKKEIKKEQNIEELNKIPPKSSISKYVGWSVPILILIIIGYTFFTNKAVGINQTISWVLWNGSLSAIGSLIALGHPLTTLTSFAAAPISSLNPTIAAGWFAGLVEAFVRKPRVKDFQNLTKDVNSIKGLWSNKVTRVLLVVVLVNIGSMVGTAIGGVEVIRLFIQTFSK